MNRKAIIIQGAVLVTLAYLSLVANMAYAGNRLIGSIQLDSFGMAGTLIAFELEKEFNLEGLFSGISLFASVASDFKRDSQIDGGLRLYLMQSVKPFGEILVGLWKSSEIPLPPLPSSLREKSGENFMILQNGAAQSQFYLSAALGLELLIVPFRVAFKGGVRFVAPYFLIEPLFALSLGIDLGMMF